MNTIFWQKEKDQRSSYLYSEGFILLYIYFFDRTDPYPKKKKESHPSAVYMDPALGISD